MRLWNSSSRSMHLIRLLVHSDFGGEFMGAAWKKVCRSNRISHTHSVPYNQHQNGIVERSWRTIGEKLRSVMLRANLGSAKWALLVSAVVYVINRTNRWFTF